MTKGPWNLVLFKTSITMTHVKWFWQNQISRTFLNVPNVLWMFCECVVTSVVSDSGPYGLWSTRLHCPWDSPGKNTGMDGHALLQGISLTQGSNLSLLSLLHWQADSLPLEPPGKPMDVLSCLVAQWDPMCNPLDYSLPGSSVHGDSPGKNTGMDCHALFQGIFPNQGSNPGLPHCRRILYHLSYQGSHRTKSVLQGICIYIHTVCIFILL